MLARHGMLAWRLTWPHAAVARHPTELAAVAFAGLWFGLQHQQMRAGCSQQNVNIAVVHGSLEGVDRAAAEPSRRGELRDAYLRFVPEKLDNIFKFYNLSWKSLICKILTLTVDKIQTR